MKKRIDGDINDASNDVMLVEKIENLTFILISRFYTSRYGHNMV